MELIRLASLSAPARGSRVPSLDLADFASLLCGKEVVHPRERKMQRVIIAPISDTAHFPGLELIARGQNIAALVGPTVRGRPREACGTDEEFLEAVMRGFADRFTFATLDEATAFAKGRLDDPMRKWFRAAQANSARESG